MRIILASALLAMSAGAASAGDLTIAPSAGQPITYLHGKPAIMSTQPHGQVALMLTAERVPEKEVAELMRIGVENRSDAATNFTRDNISITTESGPVKVMSASDLQGIAHKQISRQVWGARLRGVAAALGSASASMNGGTFESTTTHFGGMSTTTGSYTSPLAGVAQQQMAREDMAQAVADMHAAQASRPELDAEAEKHGFTPATVAPGAEAFSAVPVVGLTRAMKHLTVLVQLNGETHTFGFDVAPAN